MNAAQRKSLAILSEVEKIVYGRGEKDYGHPRENFEDEARAFTAYLRARKLLVRPDKDCQMPAECALNPRDIAMLNILQKVIRDGNAPKHDNLVDIIGYALTAHRIAVE